MNGELPDEWFRAGARDDDVDATHIRPLGTMRPAADPAPHVRSSTAASQDVTEARVASRPASTTSTSTTSTSTASTSTAPAPQPESHATSDRVSQSAVAPRSATGPADADERFTDQFKPGYIPRVETTDPGQRTAATHSASADATSSGSHTGEPAGSFGENSAGVTYSLGEVHRTPAPRRHPSGARRVRRGVQAGLLLGIVLAAGLGGGSWLASRHDQQSTPTGSVAPQSGASAQVPYSGALKLVTGVRATAECVAPAATATDGSRITYLPSNLLDGRPTTAWRCPGSAIGQKVVFTLPAHTTLVGMGIINGYAKMAPDGTDYYRRYRRVSQVTWTIDGMTANQDLTEVEDEQRVTIPPQSVDTPVTLTIVRVSDPGASDSASNATLVSTVNFYTKG